MLDSRASGILLPLFLLPSSEGIGTLGNEAYSWIDRLSNYNQKIWQILPLNPIDFSNSPYQSYSAFALEPLFIDLNTLSKEGLIKKESLEPLSWLNKSYIEYEKLKPLKYNLLRELFNNFKEGNFLELKEQFNIFKEQEDYWLNDYSLFMALRLKNGEISWNRWRDNLKFRDKEALNLAKNSLNEEIEFFKFLQFIVFRQWFNLKEYANKKGVKIIGDLPIYLSYDSSDCWANPNIFMLNENLEPKFVAGVPPDYFSSTGQRWGNPLYDWDRLKEDSFSWWILRFKHSFGLYDYLRVDHFRGFEAFWAIDANSKSAINGRWIKAYGDELFSALLKYFKELPIIAEDLGIITKEVEALRDKFNLFGMKVLEFAFDGNPNNPYLPHNHIPNSALYSGTHDNDTLVGWYNSLENREYLFEYLRSSKERIIWDIIGSIESSVSKLAIIQLQDILGLDSSARINIPGTTKGNWRWRCKEELLNNSNGAFEKLAKFSKIYGRV